jgi:hypothetical protein
MAGVVALGVAVDHERMTAIALGVDALRRR